MANCQICGTDSESLQTITLANGGLIEHKEACPRCYYAALVEQTNKKPDNLILG